jgi:hypothetical protein
MPFEELKSNRNRFMGTAIHNHSLIVGINHAIIRFSVQKLRGPASELSARIGFARAYSPSNLSSRANSAWTMRMSTE